MEHCYQFADLQNSCEELQKQCHPSYVMKIVNGISNESRSFLKYINNKIKSYNLT